MSKKRIRRRGKKKHHTVSDLIKLHNLAAEAPNGPGRVAILKAHDKVEHDLLMRGEYHRRRKMRGKK
jgi:hypothetical protein